MRSSFFVHEYWMNPGKKWLLRILAQSKDAFLARFSRSAFPSGKLWQYFVAMYSQKGSGRENAPSWQDIAEMHAKSANFGKICFLCILKGVKNAVGECISRKSCLEGPLFPSGALKSCIMSKFCHSFVVPHFARGRTASVLVLGAAERWSSGRIEALWSPFTWRCKREPAWRRAGKVRAAPLRVEAQALWELVRSCKHHEAYP